MGLVQGQLSRGGPHSRSHNCLCHLIGEPIQALQLGKPIDGSPIFNTITQKLGQHLDLLSGQVLGRQRGDDCSQVGNRPGSNLVISVINVFAQGLNKVDQSRLPGLKFCEARQSLSRTWNEDKRRTLCGQSCDLESFLLVALDGEHIVSRVGQGHDA